MRPLRASLILIAALMVVGCASWSKRRPGDDIIKPPPVQGDGRMPTEADLVRFLNQKSSALRTIDCEELDIDVKAQGNNLPGLRGDLVCETPRNFRLTGSVTGMQQVDFGSNAERFWFWIKQAPEPHIFHCAYTDFEKGNIQLQFPFNPEWVVQALGMAEYGKDDPTLGRFKLEVKPNTYELVENSTLQGRPVKKITVFNRKNVPPPAPQVIQHIVKDTSDKIICTATIKEVRASKSVDAKGIPIVYPRKMELEWPAEQVRMTLTLGRVKVNEPIPPQMSAKLFSLPNWKDVKTVDLAQYRVAPTARVQQTSGYYR